MVKKMIPAIVIAVCSFATGAFAQKVEEVTLTVSGDGATKKEATEVALRSAIEQAFGVFVSANTTIMNDELVKDEIATVASGNIKKYEEIAAAQLPNGNTSVTLKATVSVSKLITYAQSKGSSAEFAGATFGMNMKLKELNKTNEEKAIANIISQLEALVPAMFDYKIEVGEPTVNTKGNYDIPAKVYVIFNDNTEMANNILLNTLTSLTLSEEELTEYKKLKLKFEEIKVVDFFAGSQGEEEVYQKRLELKKTKVGKFKSIRQPSVYVYLRSNESVKRLGLLNDIFTQAVYDFKINTNTEKFGTFSGNHKTLKPEGFIAGFGYPVIGVHRSAGYYIVQVARSGHSTIGEYCDWISYGRIVAPHLFKNLFGKNNEEIVPYILEVTLTIPKDDIMKYNNFTITHK
jgi:hypothetical protein